MSLARSEVELTSVFRTHPGRRRTVNEDRVLNRPGDGLWAVADGMGGHRLGDLAANRVVEAIADVPRGQSGYGRLADVVSAVEAVNAGLFAQQAEGGGTSGSTLVALLAHEGHFACLWVGDSRAYRLRDGTLGRITRDHSLVQDLIDSGMMADSERRLHPSGHVITRAVGGAASLEIDRQFGAIEPGDRFLLCSDGLTACLDDGEIAAALALPDLEEAADALLMAALERDAPDNVSLVLIDGGGVG